MAVYHFPLLHRVFSKPEKYPISFVDRGIHVAMHRPPGAAGQHFARTQTSCCRGPGARRRVKMLPFVLEAPISPLPLPPRIRFPSLADPSRSLAPALSSSSSLLLPKRGENRETNTEASERRLAGSLAITPRYVGRRSPPFFPKTPDNPTGTTGRRYTRVYIYIYISDTHARACNTGGLTLG